MTNGFDDIWPDGRPGDTETSDGSLDDWKDGKPIVLLGEGTTAAPTTVGGTTSAPTTLAPTTLAPTTVAPSTEAPTTVAPTTLAPTTLAPEIGTVCFGHDTGVVEDYIANLSEGSGTASVTGAGDNERVEFQTGEEWISPVRQLGTGNAKIQLNKYQAGGNVSIQYKTGNSEANCDADSWHDFVAPGFVSLGYVRARLYK